MSRMNPLRPERRRRNASNLLLLTTTTLFVTFLPVQAQAYGVGELGEEVHPGTRAANLTCPGGKVPVGLQFKGGSFLDAMVLYCAEPTGQKTLGRPEFGARADGSQGLTNLLPGVSLRHRTVYCPTHYVLSGIKGKGGDYVDRINSIRCTRFRGDKVSFRNVGIGGTGGRVGRLYCKGADRVSRIRVRFGSWIDWLSVECRGQ